jgi:hypothetical protein
MDWWFARRVRTTRTAGRRVARGLQGVAGRGSNGEGAALDGARPSGCVVARTPKRSVCGRGAERARDVAVGRGSNPFQPRRLRAHFLSKIKLNCTKS